LPLVLGVLKVLRVSGGYAAVLKVLSVAELLF
jgi:hypothetical protein